ncbi:hypothetical protein BC830DRAFT_231005 [Chytriomyces sp. MP71]|nr:hypothetical protein BC830DRAFT_231005 [Chytriomyces sp. MP71]
MADVITEATASLMQSLKASPHPMSSRGRKLEMREPATRRQLLNRENQRAARERTRATIAALQKQVDEFHAAMQARNAEMALLRDEVERLRLIGNGVARTATCPNCTSLAMQCRDLQLRLIAAQAEVERSKVTRQPATLALASVPFRDIVGLNSQTTPEYLARILQHNVPLSPTVILTTPPAEGVSPLSNYMAMKHADDWFDIVDIPTPKSAEELFGPPKLEFTRYSLNALPSLANAKDKVDLFVNLLYSLAKVTDKGKLKRLMIRNTLAFHNIMGLCTDAEKTQAQEIVHLAQEVNPGFLEYLTILLSDGDISSTTCDLSQPVPDSAKDFNAALKRIPSIACYTQIIDELSILVSMVKKGPLEFIETILRISMLRQRATPEDGFEVNEGGFESGSVTNPQGVC